MQKMENYFLSINGHRPDLSYLSGQKHLPMVIIIDNRQKSLQAFFSVLVTLSKNWFSGVNFF